MIYTPFWRGGGIGCLILAIVILSGGLIGGDDDDDLWALLINQAGEAPTAEEERLSDDTGVSDGVFRSNQQVGSSSLSSSFDGDSALIRGSSFSLQYNQRTRVANFAIGRPGYWLQYDWGQEGPINIVLRVQESSPFLEINLMGDVLRELLALERIDQRSLYQMVRFFLSWHTVIEMMPRRWIVPQGRRREDVGLSAENYECLNQSFLKLKQCLRKAIADAERGDIGTARKRRLVDQIGIFGGQVRELYHSIARYIEQGERNSFVDPTSGVDRGLLFLHDLQVDFLFFLNAILHWMNCANNSSTQQGIQISGDIACLILLKIEQFFVTESVVEPSLEGGARRLRRNTFRRSTGQLDATPRALGYSSFDAQAAESGEERWGTIASISAPSRGAVGAGSAARIRPYKRTERQNPLDLTATSQSSSERGEPSAPASNQTIAERPLKRQDTKRQQPVDPRMSSSSSSLPVADSVVQPRAASSTHTQPRVAGVLLLGDITQVVFPARGPFSCASRMLTPPPKF